MMLSSPRSCHYALAAALALLSAACSSPDEQKQRHFAQGNAYVGQKRDDFAVIEYANAVRIDPKFGEARWKLAQTYERMNNIQAAFPEYIRAADALPDNREAQIKATELLLMAQRFEDAKSRATAVLSKNPKDLDAMLLRANAMAGLKDPAGALAEIDEALKLQPNESRAYMSLGNIRRQGGETREAEEAYKQAITLSPSAASHVAFASFLLSVGRLPEAEQAIKQAITLAPRDVLANRMLAFVYLLTNRQADAEQPLKVIAEVSKTPETRFALAQYYSSAGRSAEATDLLTRLAAEPASAARAEATLAAMDYDKGRKQEAHARLDKLLASSPKNGTALVLKARWLANENKLDEALERAKTAVAADSQSASAYFTLGHVHSRRLEVPAALDAYREALRLNPRLVSAQLELARLNLISGNRDAALRYSEEAKRSAPENPNVRVELVRALLTAGDTERSGVEIAQLLRSQPDSSVVHALNGMFRALRKDQAGARTAYTRALELDPQNVDAIGGLIVLDLGNKQVSPAVKRIEAALAKQPKRIELLILAARVYDAAGQREKTEQVLRQVVAAEPRFLGGYAMLAQLYLKQGRLDEARSEFETIVKRDPRAVGPRTLVGIILQVQRKHEEAKRWYEATVADIADAPVAANNLAFIYAEEGSNLDVALQLASSAKKQMPDSPEVSDTLGWVYYKKDLATLAVGPLEESVKKSPDNAEVLYHLGMTYAKIGDNAKSRAALERALKLNPKMAGAATARQTLGSLTQ